MKLLIEAIIVGLSLALFTRLLRQSDLINTKNEFLFLVVVGALLHLTFEGLKLNKWYCKHGAACIKE